MISIHALRVEGDGLVAIENHPFLFISIHALRVEGDLNSLFVLDVYVLFLSTPSGWRATVCPCGFYKVCFISIHALRVEGD